MQAPKKINTTANRLLNNNPPCIKLILAISCVLLFIMFNLLATKSSDHLSLANKAQVRIETRSNNVLAGLQPELQRECVCRRDITKVSWAENILVWDQPAQERCNFHHFSPSETKQLLLNQTLVVMGDSLSRELAINMAGILLDSDYVTALVNQDTGNHIDLQPLEFMHHTNTTPYHITFLWANLFPLILLKAQHAIPIHTTTAIISFGAWMHSNFPLSVVALRFDLVALVHTLCSKPGNTTFVIRLPTITADETINPHYEYVRDQMLAIIFPNNITSICCGRHSIVLHDTYTIMDKRSHQQRLPANHISHFAPIMRVNMMQSVLNLLPHISKTGYGDLCCVRNLIKAPVEHSTVAELVADVTPDCVAESHAHSIQPFACAVRRYHNPAFNQNFKPTLFPAYFYFYPQQQQQQQQQHQQQQQQQQQQRQQQQQQQQQPDSVWILAQATQAVNCSFSMYINELYVCYELEMFKWQWFELLPRASDNRDWVWWTSEAWCGKASTFASGCRVLKMVPRTESSDVAAVYVGPNNTRPSHELTRDMLSRYSH